MACRLEVTSGRSPIFRPFDYALLARVVCGRGLAFMRGRGDRRMFLVSEGNAEQLGAAVRLGGGSTDPRANNDDAGEAEHWVNS